MRNRYVHDLREQRIPGSIGNKAKNLKGMPRETLELMEAIDRNFKLAQEAACYNIVVPLMGMWFSLMLRGQLAKAGEDFEALDLTDGMPETGQLDPIPHLARLNEQYRALRPELQALVAEGKCDELRRREEAVPPAGRS